jgi:hypothetical protein
LNGKIFYSSREAQIVIEWRLSLLKNLSGLGIGLPMKIAADDF